MSSSTGKLVMNFASCDCGFFATYAATHARRFGPAFARNVRKRPAVISYLSRRLSVFVGMTRDAQQLSCVAPASPVSPPPHVSMPAVSAVAHEGSVHLFLPGAHALVLQSVSVVQVLSTA